MKIACIMMQKNESKLLKPWVEYHSLIFGLENMYVYDNGSTDQECIDTLMMYEKNGLNVEWGFKSKEDFEKKGYLFSERIKRFDNSTSPYDFYFPLDCDEFIAYERAPGDLLLDRRSIEIELDKYVGSQSVLAINAGYDNNPLLEKHYFRSEGQRKSFFYKGTCLTLDMGFHSGKTKAGSESQKTSIVYIHHHYKEFHEYQKSAKQKLLGRVVDFSLASLEKHRDKKGAGYHLIGALLATEHEYYSSFYNSYASNTNKYYYMAFVSSHLKGLGLNQSAPEQIKAICVTDNSIRGVIDSIVVTKDSLKLTGWAISPDENKCFIIYIFGDNNKYIKILNSETYNRPDVVRAIEHSYLKCGIIAEQKLSSEDFDTLHSKELKIIFKNNSSSSRINFNQKNMTINT
ncbi:glycosyltransferase family 2 protein [Aeromonas media]|uniref:glycosyltransferase family 2 protein n=1 Tax=Aeromonas media TaxID=651 RepID=UPI003D213CD6